MELSENLIGTAEAAKILSKSHRTVHRLAKSGALVPVVTVPGGHHGTHLFLRADVEALAAGIEKASA